MLVLCTNIKGYPFMLVQSTNIKTSGGILCVSEAPCMLFI